MEELLRIVSRLEKIRGLPQFIFNAPINGRSLMAIKDEIIKFKATNPSIDEIDFILESPGGSADIAYLMIKFVRENFKKVNIIVPFWAKSAATLFALGATTIIMDDFGQFGPLDVQLTKNDELPESDPQSGLIDEYSLITIENRGIALYQRFLTKALKRNKNSDGLDVRLKKVILSEQILKYISDLYRPLFDKIDPYQIGEKSRKLAIAERYAERILTQYNSDNMNDEIAYFVDYMVHECPDHGYIIDYTIISQFLRNVYKSSSISIDYSVQLSQLSTLFIKASHEAVKYIGFLKQDPVEKSTKKDNNKVKLKTRELPRNTKVKKV